MSFGRNSHVAKAESEEQKARSAKDSGACELAWREGARQWERAAEEDKAIEINSRPERLDPPRRLLRPASDIGCKFCIDTDAHTPGQLDWQINGCERAVECAVPAERIVNARDDRALLAWSASHGA
jgi:histidinol phosphatase-like PHP family hydrolase